MRHGGSCARSYDGIKRRFAGAVLSQLVLQFGSHIPLSDARFDGRDDSIKGLGCQTQGPADFFNLINGFDCTQTLHDPCPVPDRHPAGEVLSQGIESVEREVGALDCHAAQSKRDDLTGKRFIGRRKGLFHRAGDSLLPALDCVAGIEKEEIAPGAEESGGGTASESEKVSNVRQVTDHQPFGLLLFQAVNESPYSDGCRVGCRFLRWHRHALGIPLRT